MGLHAWGWCGLAERVLHATPMLSPAYAFLRLVRTCGAWACPSIAFCQRTIMLQYSASTSVLCLFNGLFVLACNLHYQLPGDIRACVIQACIEYVLYCKIHVSPGNAACIASHNFSSLLCTDRQSSRGPSRMGRSCSCTCVSNVTRREPRSPARTELRCPAERSVAPVLMPGQADMGCKACTSGTMGDSSLGMTMVSSPFSALALIPEPSNSRCDAMNRMYCSQLLWFVVSQHIEDAQGSTKKLCGCVSVEKCQSKSQMQSLKMRGTQSI